MLNKELFIEEIEILNHKRAKFSESGIISLELRKSAVNFIALFLYNKRKKEEKRATQECKRRFLFSGAL